MSNISRSRTVAIVYYEIQPIKSTFKDELNKHLFSNVCLERNFWGENIYVIDDEEEYITEVMYRFNDDYYESDALEVGELIEKEIAIWAAKTNVNDIVAA